MTSSPGACVASAFSSSSTTTTTIEIWVTALSYSGALVTTASSAREALPLTPAVDVVVTDMSMPGEDGERLLAQVEQSRRPIPVIVLTGLDRRYFTGDKFARVLRKPFDLWHLCQEILAVLGGGAGPISAGADTD